MPQDRIDLSHTCHYFRNLIISPRGLSDLWLYIYHIPISPKSQPRTNRSRSSAFHPYMIFNSNSTTQQQNANISNTGNTNQSQNNNNNSSINSAIQNTIGPSHATSLPNTLATSTAMSSRQLSIRSLFKASSASSSHSQTQNQTANQTPSLSPNIKPLSNDKIEEEDISISSMQLSPNVPVHNLRYHEQSQNNDEDNDEQKYDKIASSSSSSSMETDQVTGDLSKGHLSDSTVSSSDPLLEHPTNPVLTSKIIYWPNYKQVLACDFPMHWRRKNSFYENLCILSKNCGGAHIRVFEVGMERLMQVLSRISPMLLSLCLINVHVIHMDSYAFS